MVVLVLDLKNGSVVREEWKEGYLGLRCAFSLHEKYGKDSLVLASITDASSSELSIKAWPIVYFSDITRKGEAVLLNTAHGYSFSRMGIAAVVITGRADRLRYVTLSPSGCEILPIENMRAEYSGQFESVVASMGDICLSTGVAADKGVYFGSVQFKGRNIQGNGLGHAFYTHNLKGIVMPSFQDSNPALEGERVKDRDRSAFGRLVRSYGEYAVIGSALRLGWAPVNNYSERFDPRVYNIDGMSVSERYGNYPDGCLGCSLACLRRTKDGLSLPSWSDLFFLGPNIGFFDLGNIVEIYSSVIRNGLEIPTVGAMLSYIFTLPEDERALYSLKDHTVEAVLAFIEKVSTGALLSKGLESLPDAIQSYNHRPIFFDVRGSFAHAILLSQGLDLILPGTLFFPKKSVSERVAAVFALYETIYSLALREMGYPTFFLSSLYWAKVPQIAFRSPFFARFFLRRFNAFGYSSRELLKTGYEVFESLNLEWHPIPEHFTMDSVSSFDATTVPLKRLQDYYDEEKLRLIIFLKSEREKTESPSGVKSANVGPDDERGSDADPGFNI